MKAPRQRGREGNWLREARLARGFSNARAARDAPYRFTGHNIHYSAWAAYESGSRTMGELHKSWLEQFFGAMPEPEPETAALAGAIGQLVVEVRLARVAQETIAQALAEMTGWVAALLDRAGTPDAASLLGGGDSLRDR